MYLFLLKDTGTPLKKSNIVGILYGAQLAALMILFAAFRGVM